MRTRTRSTAVIALALILGLSGLAVAEEGLLDRIEKEVRSLASRSGPAVVTVTAKMSTPLFGHDFPTALQALLERSSPVGTGFLVSEDGLVVTTHRIARGAETAQVEFPNGLLREGKILGADSFFQVALVRVDPVEGVTPLTLAEEPEAEDVSLGVFVGNSFGTARNVSLGVATRAPARPEHPHEYDNYLFLNAPMHPGDEGGPFVGPKGEVVAVGAGRFDGAVSVSLSGEGSRLRLHGFSGSGGMGLLLPASDVRYAIGEIERYGRVRHGKLGVFLKPSTLEIRVVQPDTPAAEAGLVAGDLIVGVDESPMRTDAEFRFRLRRISIDTRISIQVKRGDKVVTVRSCLADRGLPPRTLEVLPGVKVFAEGPPVVAFVKGRPDPRPGDRIVSVNGVKVGSAADVARSLVQLSSPKVSMVVTRGEKSVALEITR